MAKLLREKVAADHLLGKTPQPEHLRERLEGDAAVYKPDGSPLLVLRRGAVSQAAADAAYPFLHELRRHGSNNRGSYSGVPLMRRVRRDGSLSNTNISSIIVETTIVGYFNRNPRFPYCRATALVTRYPEEWATLQPMIQEAATIFRELLPQRYAAQQAAAAATHPAYVIPGTPFTTLTVNNTVPAAYHRDKGDYARGFGCMAVLRRGSYTGGDLVLPAYRVGVDLQDRDLVLFDVHELHGNLPIVGQGPRMLPEDGGYERLSVVFYFREKMTECLAPEAELERVKLVRGGLRDAP